MRWCQWPPALPVIFIISSAFISRSSAQYSSLNCVQATDNSDLVQTCTGSDTLPQGAQDTFTFDIFALDGYSEFESFEVDMDCRLTSVTGNVDLVVTSPSGIVWPSTRNVGTDIVYVNRHEIESGEYTLSVVGVGASSNYVLTVYVTQERLLNPWEQLILGQFLIDCCSLNPNSCTSLKQKYPSLADNDNSTNPNLCYIHGNVCSRDGRMQELSLPNNSMSCALPAQSLAQLPKLERIDLSYNQISGNISQIAGALAKAPMLQFVDFTSNAVIGQLNQSCGFAQSGMMQQISLGSNLLTGSVPACLLGLKQLWEFHVDYNALTGTIPAIPNAKTSRLVRFTGANQTQQGGGFNGSLPASISELSRLAYLDFSGNNLTGDLPRFSSTIRKVNLANNQLTNGGQATALPPTYVLNLQNNQLSGNIPAQITSINSLMYLDVSTNQITDNLPPQWSGLSNLNLLKLDNNQLTGTIPGNLASLPNLNLLDLSNNQFSGTLDDYSNQMSNSQAGTVYRYFNASYNQIIGPMSDLSGMASLGIFTPQALSVAVGTSAGSQAPLTLDLSGNAFSGIFPDWLFYAIVNAAASVNISLAGSTLMCPYMAYTVTEEYDPSRLDSLTCQQTNPDGTVSTMPMTAVVMEEPDDDGLSGGAIFGIILAVLIAVGALAYIAWHFYQQRQKQKAMNAAQFGSNVGGFGNLPQSRTGASGNYSSFSDDQAWSNPNSALLASPPSKINTTPKKQVGLASMPLSQKGEF